MMGDCLRAVGVVTCAVLMMIAVPPAAAQEDSPVLWGGPAQKIYFVSGEELQDVSTTGDWHSTGDGFWRGSGWAEGPVHLPSGALVTGMNFAFRDADGVAGHDFSVRLVRSWVSPPVFGSEVLASYDSSGSPGVTAQWADVAPDHTFRHLDGVTLQSYVVRVATAGDSDDVAFRGVTINWYLQVSPAPAVATFADVPETYWAFQHIEALAESQITAGCGGGNFCPDAPLTRAQMAVFLAKALGLHWAY